MYRKTLLRTYHNPIRIFLNISSAILLGFFVSTLAVSAESEPMIALPGGAQILGTYHR
jgi:hypothetical protein